MKGVAKIAPSDRNVELIDVPVPSVLPGHVLIEIKAAGVLWNRSADLSW